MKKLLDTRNRQLVWMLHQGIDVDVVIGKNNLGELQILPVKNDQSDSKIQYYRNLFLVWVKRRINEPKWLGRMATKFRLFAGLKK